MSSKEPDDEIKHIEEEIKQLKESQQKFEKKIDLRSIIVIVCISSLILIGVGMPLFKTRQFGSEIPLTSGYEIFDMKGERVSTWIAWKTVQGDLFHVNVLESPEVTPQRLSDIRDAVFSNQTVIMGQTYYKGWSEALKSIKTGEKIPIPTNFHIDYTNTGAGNIVIRLTNAENGDGYSGFTKTIADVSNNEALKSTITIYNVDKLTDHELRVIMRHELGHALGIAYSDNPDDVMHLIVSQDRPYISPCDIQAMEALYNGQEKSTIVCTT